MLLGLCLLILIPQGHTHKAEDYCVDPPPVYRGNHFEMFLNQTEYNYGQGIQVTVRPRVGGSYRYISDMFLHVPGTDKHPGQYGSNSVGRWYTMPPGAPVSCNWWWVASGVKSFNAYVPSTSLHALWIAPQPEYKNNFSSDPEYQRPYIYFVVYVTPDPPIDTKATRGSLRRQRKWYYAASVRVDNREAKARKMKQQQMERHYRKLLRMFESFS